MRGPRRCRTPRARPPRSSTSCSTPTNALDELRLARLPAAAEQPRSRLGGGRRARARRTSRPRSSGQKDFDTAVDQLCSCRLAGERRLGRRLVEVHRAVPEAVERSRRWRRPRRLWPALAAARVSLARRASSSCRSTASWPSPFGRLDPIFGNARTRCGTRCSGTSRCSTTSSDGSSNGELGRVVPAHVRLRRRRPRHLLPHRLPGRVLRARATAGRAGACCSACCWRRSGSTT